MIGGHSKLLPVRARVSRDLVSFYRSFPDPRIVDHDDKVIEFPRSRNWVRSTVAFVERLRARMCAPPTFVMAAGVYMLRIQSLSGPYPERFTLRELFSACFLLAFKYLEEKDDVFCVTRVSKASDVGKKRLLELEWVLWGLLDFRLIIRPRDVHEFFGKVGYHSLTRPFPDKRVDPGRLAWVDSREVLDPDQEETGRRPLVALQNDYVRLV